MWSWIHLIERPITVSLPHLRLYNGRLINQFRLKTFFHKQGSCGPHGVVHLWVLCMKLLKKQMTKCKRQKYYGRRATKILVHQMKWPVGLKRKELQWLSQQGFETGGWIRPFWSSSWWRATVWWRRSARRGPCRSWASSGSPPWCSASSSAWTGLCLARTLVQVL